MTTDLPTPEAPVLSTMHEDGSRRWMRPKLSKGRFLRARRIVAYILIGVFTLAPYVSIAGKPAVLLNIPAREFTILGFTFLPTDTVLLALAAVTGIISIFLVTALFGRVWCGWMCPQTVYMEFLYRPLERLFDGRPRAKHRPGTKKTPLRTVLKYLAFLAVSAFLAHTFLAYFVGVASLRQWVVQSPVQHPMPFLIMLAVTGLMFGDFSYFREQTCIVACPYGRFQSVMLDRDSLIVTYDEKRGEPRRRRGPKGGAEPPVGDCVDCGMCTDTCPTGIDIRNGLQLECIACTQCIDACDRVMDKMKRPRGLIRFSSQNRVEGEGGRLIRPRVVIYPSIVLVLLTLFTIVLSQKQSADVTLLRGRGKPFNELTPGEITSEIRVKIKNRSGSDAEYTVEVADGVPAQLSMAESPIPVSVGQAREMPVMITLPRDVYQEGRLDIHLRVSDGNDFSKVVEYRLLGPFGPAPTPPDNGQGGDDG